MDEASVRRSGPGSRRAWWRPALAVCVVCAGLLGTWLFGLVALPIAVVLATVVALASGPRGAMGSGIAGGLVGMLAAAGALAEVGHLEPYASRGWCGWLAYALAALATLAATRIPARPRAAGTTLLAAGVGGFVAINLYYINTWYVASWLLMSAAGLWALVMPRQR